MVVVDIPKRGVYKMSFRLEGFEYKKKNGDIFFNLLGVTEENVNGVSYQVNGFYTNIKINTFRGFGDSIGNLLRRALMGSNSFIEGIAPVAVYLNGLKSPFDDRNTFLEQPTFKIINNITNLNINANENINLNSFTLSVKKVGNVFAGDLLVPNDIEVINKDLFICSSAKEVDLKICLGRGFGFQASIEHVFEPKLSNGFFAIDSNFRKVLSCSLKVEEKTVSNRTFDEVFLRVHSSISIKEKIYDIFDKVKNLLTIDRNEKEDKKNEKFSVDSEIELFSIITDPNSRLILGSLGLKSLGDLDEDKLNVLKNQLTKIQFSKLYEAYIKLNSQEKEILL